MAKTGNLSGRGKVAFHLEFCRTHRKPKSNLKVITSFHATKILWLRVNPINNSDAKWFRRHPNSTDLNTKSFNYLIQLVVFTVVAKVDQAKNRRLTLHFQIVFHHSKIF